MVGVCLSVNISAPSKGSREGEDWLNVGGSLLAVMMISDWLFTSSTRQKSGIWEIKSLCMYIHPSYFLLGCVCAYQQVRAEV